MLDLITVGNFAMDRIISSRIACPTVTLGGSATFVSLAAKKLGAKVGVVSKVGKDFRRHLAWLRENGVDVSHVQIEEDMSTTSFVLSYSDNQRRLQLIDRAPQILLGDVPTCLRARVIHVAPIADELPLKAVQKLRDKAPLISVDPQGFLREFDETGYMKLRRLEDISYLIPCDVLKSSTEEIRMVTGYAKLGASIKKLSRLGVKTILVTMGEKGALAYLNEKFYHIPAYKPKVFKDPTGAGDVFIGAFLAEYLKGKELAWCCCVGSAAASFVIEEVGSRRFGNSDEVYERATKIYEKGINPLPHNIVV